MEFSSKPETIQAPAVQLYALLCDYERCGQLIAPQLSDFTSIENGFRFNFQGMTVCNLQLISQTPCSQVSYHIESDKKIAADIVFLITDNGDCCLLQIKASANVPFFMQAMIKKPLEKMVESAVQQIKQSLK